MGREYAESRHKHNTVRWGTGWGRELSIIGTVMALMGALARNAWSQEMSALGWGAAQFGDTCAHTYAWQIDYMERIGNRFGWSLSYLNEGHLPDHHRDGPAFQLWARTDVFQRRLSLAAGTGAYRFF